MNCPCALPMDDSSCSYDILEHLAQGSWTNHMDEQETLIFTILSTLIKKILVVIL